MFQTRKAVYDDAEAIANIHITSWKSTYKELLNEKDISNITYENRLALWETILKIQKEDQCTFVIYNEEKIVGFVNGGPERTKRFSHDSEIYTIYLLDEYQRLGLGADLLQVFAEDMKAKGSNSILVWVLKQNPSSKFYVRYQAEPVGVEETTIGEGTYQETAYGWESIDELLCLIKRNRS
ncbi:GNAT family N-acetyltransferase [Virgibacillus necropolis]|uniref:GNAT family N-acetyltransferase n=1 Tax=Virgibacillus necropolis TaxID=163877 RepID=A0A221MG74_9BACI|nr:GNAT family N-acetyltransferase [Virgibacillus necropolis]ASN06612.1 GNAT family N-acetyltransferase [Virgibacillus necropolis]